MFPGADIMPFAAARASRPPTAGLRPRSDHATTLAGRREAARGQCKAARGRREKSGAREWHARGVKKAAPAGAASDLGHRAARMRAGTGRRLNAR
jgi:hypothetical protein